MKKILSLLVILLVGLGLVGCKKVYKIGETGPAGGIIFYDKGTFTDGWRYLEAAPAQTEFSAKWGGGMQVDGSGRWIANGIGIGTSNHIGAGKQNTQLIVNRLGAGSYAAAQCNSLNIGNFSDWFLPSKDELNSMYRNLTANGFGAFNNDYYWSSSEIDASFVRSQNFSDGSHQYGNYRQNKNDANRVRAIRAF